MPRSYHGGIGRRKRVPREPQGPVRNQKPQDLPRTHPRDSRELLAELARSTGDLSPSSFDRHAKWSIIIGSFRSHATCEQGTFRGHYHEKQGRVCQGRFDQRSGWREQVDQLPDHHMQTLMMYSDHVLPSILQAWPVELGRSHRSG